MSSFPVSLSLNVPVFWLSGLQNAIQVPLIVSDSLVCLKLLACSARNTLCWLRLYLAQQCTVAPCLTCSVACADLYIYSHTHQIQPYVVCAQCKCRNRPGVVSEGSRLSWRSVGCCWELLRAARTDIWQDILVAAVKWEAGQVCDTNLRRGTQREVTRLLWCRSVWFPNCKASHVKLITNVLIWSFVVCLNIFFWMFYLEGYVVCPL